MKEPKKGLQAYQYLFIVLGIEALASLFVALYLGEYASTLFILVPFSFGVFTGTFADKTTLRPVAFVMGGALVLLGICGVLIFAKIEGLICVAMALPFIVLPFGLGYLLGLWFQRLEGNNSQFLIIPLLLANPLSLHYDVQHDETFISTVQTEIVINAPVEKVWQTLTHRVDFSQNVHWLFEQGVSYPTSMELKIRKGQSFLDCSTNNETKIALKITALDSLQHFRFEPTSSLVPMHELSPYSELHAPHLQGYFTVKYGKFALIPLDNGKTKLVANSEYSYRIRPHIYWKYLSDYIVNTMHQQVLNDVKKQAE